MSVEAELTALAVAAVFTLTATGALVWITSEACVWLVIRTVKHFTK